VIRVLVDINVVLDVLADREPFAEAPSAALGEIESGRVEGCLAAHAITTLHFLSYSPSTSGKLEPGEY
jgi:hypothetical protein